MGNKRKIEFGIESLFTETVGFEPTRAFRPYLVSSEALSAAQPRLQNSVSVTCFLEFF